MGRGGVGLRFLGFRHDEAPSTGRRDAPGAHNMISLRRLTAHYEEKRGRYHNIGPPHPRSPPRSVALRAEIGPVPARDRSYPAPRSVQFRLEIGRTPRRDRSTSTSRLRCVRTSETWVSVSGGVVLGVGGRVRRAGRTWVALPASSWPLYAGGGGCCTLACIRRRWEPRNHAEQHYQQRARSCSHVRSPPDRTWEQDRHTP